MSVPPGFPPRWCTEHGEQLEKVAREFRSRKRTGTAVKPKPPERRGPPKLPLEVRMQRVVEHVAANGPITRDWLYEAVFVDGSGPENPYWPGTVTWLRETGPPGQVGVLADVDLP